MKAVLVVILLLLALGAAAYFTGYLPIEQAAPAPKVPRGPRDVRKEVAALHRLNPKPRVWVGLDSSEKEVLRAVQSSAFGYKDEITVFAILDPAHVCLGVNIVREDESPDYASGIYADTFLSQLVGKDEDGLKLTTGGTGIDAVSGATRSSEAVLKAVGKAMRRARLAKGPKGKGTIQDVVTWMGTSDDGRDIICTIDKKAVLNAIASPPAPKPTPAPEKETPKTGRDRRQN